MELREKAGELVALVRKKFPSWQGFDDPSFEQEEVTYKQKTIAKARELLSCEELERLIQEELFKTVIERLEQLGRDNNLLWLRVPMQGDLNILYQPELDGVSFCRVLFDLLYGPGPSEVRLERYVSYCQERGLPCKWTFPTYFLFLCHSETEMFVKPSIMSWLLRFVGRGGSWTVRPSGGAYAAIKQTVAELKEALAAYGPRDNVDIQGLVYVAYQKRDQQAAPQAMRYWKIAPGEGAHLWDLWREQGVITIGWNDLGDIEGLDQEAFEARCEEVGQREGWAPKGAHDVWRFTHQIQIGDRIVANQGKNVVLGIGTVTGEYRYVPDAPHVHQRAVRWDDLTPRHVDESGWVRTVVKLSKQKFEAIQNAPPVGDDHAYERALEQLRDVLARARQDGEFQKIEAGRDEVLGRYGAIFASERIGQLTEEEFRSFLRLENNKHWSNLSRMGNAATADMGRLRRALALLLDESKPLAERYDEATGMIHGMGKAIATAILLVAYPDRYGVWNNTSEGALKQLGLWPDFEHGLSEGQRYEFLNGRVLQRLACDLGVDLWTLDGLWWLVGKDELAEPQGSYESSPKPVGFFSATTFDLLAQLAENPTNAFYQEHKAAFVEHVEEPFKSFFRALAERLPPIAKEMLETEKYIFSRIPKNDYGQGGAWPHYWGAFYPKGSKRSAGAQLMAYMKAEKFALAFYIGEYGELPKQRFWRNVRTYRDVLPRLLASQFDALDLRCGDPELEQMGWRTWLAQEQPFYRVEMCLTPEKTTGMSRDELLELGQRTFATLFPLALLAMEEDPLPAIQAYLGDEDEEEPELNPPYPLTKCAEETGFDAAELARWVRAIERKGQAILYGPPGTGKTYLAERLAQHLIAEGDGFYEIVQFHPAYAYEDIIQGLRPYARADGGLDYRLVSGRFLDFCRRARICSGRCVLIIDEINRANLARVFGELMYLLEYRNREVPLAGGSTLRIPKNVRLIGTMNTADRSIALVDHALRRRFAFLSLYPRYEVLRRYHQRHNSGFPVERLIQVLKELNNQINDRHYEVGISFFLRENVTEEELADIWRMEIEPYLEEYFFDQPQRADNHRWEKVRGRIWTS